MKTKLLMTVTVFVSMITATAQAGGFGVYGSYWSPADVDPGYGGGVKLTTDLTPELGFELRGSYFPDLSEDLSTPVGTVDTDLEVMAAEAGLRVAIPLQDASVRPYVGAGGGYYFMEVENEGINGVGEDTVDVDDELGWYLLGGLEVGLSDTLALFAEAQYRNFEATAQGDDLDEIDGEVEIDMDGIGANAGFAVTW
ncbi:MAG TPA: OmpW family outer membrane protein [Kiritimatiellia bacterium]|jgi:outer membrane protein W